MAENSSEGERSSLLINSETTVEVRHDTQSSLNYSTNTFNFKPSWQFLGLRILLRILSIWCPRSSCCLEKFVYPVLVNLLLLIVVLITGFHLYRADIITSHGLLVYFIISAGAYCSHIAAICYFRSRDLEDNMIKLKLEQSLSVIFRKQLLRYNIRLVLSLLIIPLFFLYTEVIWKGGLDGVEILFGYYWYSIQIYVMAAAHFHNLGMYLALLWMVDLLQLVSNVRLKDQYQTFVSWNLGVEEAIKYHVANYSEKIQLSCHRLRIWFFIHNGFLIIAVPTFVLGDATVLQLLNVETFLRLFGLFVTPLIIWAIPLYWAEQIQKNDETFCCNINNICSFTLNTTRNETAVQINTANSGNNNGNNDDNLTFASRSELNLMVVYLQNIKSGFLSVGFTFQLRFSQISTLVSLLTLVIGHSFRT